MHDHNRNKRTVYSDWTPRESGGGLDWSKVQIAPPGEVAVETGLDAGGRPWIRLQVPHGTSSDPLLFRLL